MNKLIAKLLYPIYAELCKMRENQAKWNGFTNRYNKQEDIESACASRSWSYGEAVSAEPEPISTNNEAQQALVTGWREGEPMVSAQNPFIDRN